MEDKMFIFFGKGDIGVICGDLCDNENIVCLRFTKLGSRYTIGEMDLEEDEGDVLYDILWNKNNIKEIESFKSKIINNSVVDLGDCYLVFQDCEASVEVVIEAIDLILKDCIKG